MRSKLLSWLKLLETIHPDNWQFGDLWVQGK